MEKEFTDWFEANEKRFAHGQFDEKQIAYSAWLEGRKLVKNNAVLPHVSGFVPPTLHIWNRAQSMTFTKFNEWVDSWRHDR